MNSFVVIWNPRLKGYKPEEYNAHIAATKSGQESRMWWSFGNRRQGAEKGDKVYLVRTKDMTGIVASVYLETGEIYERPSWDDPNEMLFAVDVVWKSVVRPQDRLTTDELVAGVEGAHWNNIQASGQQLRPETAAKLERVWTGHLARAGLPIA